MNQPPIPHDLLAQELVTQYDREGYLVVRGVLDADVVAGLAKEAELLLERRDLIDTQNIRCRWSDHLDTGACTFDCFDPVIDIGPVSRFVAHHERILTPLRAIYRDEAHLFKDKLIFKPPGVKGYQLHQDYISWPQFPESFVTVVVAIDSTDRDNGAIEVFPGYHRQGSLSPRDGDYHELPMTSVDAAKGVLLELSPGDIAIFSGFTPHRSAPNRSPNWRRQLYLSYNAARDGGEQRAAHYQQFHAWLVEKYAQYGKTGVYFR